MKPPCGIPFSYKYDSAETIPNTNACKSSSGKYLLVPSLSDNRVSNEM
jgi:hypothetical protein